MLTPSQLAHLETSARRVLESIIRLATDGGCFLGASHSCTDLVFFIYPHFLNISRHTMDDSDRA